VTTYFAQSSSNINASNVWNTAANGSGSYLTWPPAAGDVLMANGKTITVNVSVTVAEVRNDTTGGATVGGYFDLTNGVTLTANIYAGGAAGQCVRFALAYPNTAAIVGNILGGSIANSYGLAQSSTGVLTITGNITGGSANNTYGIYRSGGVLNITGNLTGGSGTNSSGVNMEAGSETVTITGNLYGSNSTVSSYGLRVNIGTAIIHGSVYGTSSGGGLKTTQYTTNITINGNVVAVGTSSAFIPAIYNGQNYAGVAVITVNGDMYASDYAPAGHCDGPSIFIINGNAYTAANGRQAVMGLCKYNPTARNNVMDINGVQITHGVVSTPDNYVPASNHVRASLSYAAGALTGTCAVPGAASVLAGVPVDATVGTATLVAADIRSALGLASANLDTQLSALATSDDIPSAATVAEAVRTELTPELDTITAINDRIELQVPEGPVVVIPAPAIGQTTAWTMCYDEHGLAAENVEIAVQLYATGAVATSAWESTPILAYSNADGLAAVSLPRKAGLRFQVRRGSGAWVSFSGVDAATLELPAIVDLVGSHA
jgi:hypothetical protein